VPEADSDTGFSVYASSTGAFPGWDGVEIDFDADRPRPAPAPAQTPATATPPAPEAAGAPAQVVPDPAAQPRRRFWAAKPPPAPPAPPAQPAAAPARSRLAALGRLRFLESVAVLLLLAGVLRGLPLLMVLGWLVAYASQSLTPLARKFAALGIPALAVVATGIWAWGRTTGRWGGPPPTDAQLKEDLRSLIPVVLRSAACASAAFLAWNGLRRRRS
jgi:hypothetical protein